MAYRKTSVVDVIPEEPLEIPQEFYRRRLSLQPVSSSDGVTKAPSDGNLKKWAAIIFYNLLSFGVFLQGCTKAYNFQVLLSKYDCVFFLKWCHFFAGSESPAPFPGDNKGRQFEEERIRQMAKRLIGADIAEKQLSNEISAPYEVPQYPIEQIETKLIR